MKRALSVALAIALSVSVPLAFADRTTTQLTAGSRVTLLQFDLTQSGRIVALVCGRSPLNGGGFSNLSCYSTDLTSGSIYTAVNTLANGTALTFWQNQEGL